MWIFFNDGFVSAVQDRGDPGRLCVRARNPEHLRRLFPGVKVVVTPGADYACRVFVSRAEFARAVVERVEAIDYPNFKGSVADSGLHDLYLDIWQSGWSYQQENMGEPGDPPRRRGS